MARMMKESLLFVSVESDVIRGQSLLGFGVWDLEPAAFGSVHGRK